ncbi:hypothetical protein ES703_15113 [subsurface metagenome]
MNWIINLLADVTDFFGDLYQETYDKPWPVYLMAPFFIDLYYAFYDLTYEFSRFRDWVNSVQAQIQDILSWATIRSYITDWLRYIASPLYWFYNLWSDVWGEIESWWEGTISTVQEWIALATQGFTELKAEWDNFWTVTFPGVLGELEGLWGAWSNFWTLTFPTLVDFTWLGIWWDARVTDIEGLIETAFTRRELFWEGWQELRTEVTEFFVNPLDWLESKFTDWFLGEE